MRRSVSSLWARLRVDGATNWRELAVYAAALSIATVALLHEHVLESGFYSDDWAYRMMWVHNAGEGFWAQLDGIADSDPLHGRPTLGVYLSLVEWILGSRQGLYLAWAAGLAVVFSSTVYLFLRVLRFRPLDAGLIGLLLLVFPASDSTRIWWIISDAQVAMSLALLGVTCSLAALRAPTRRRIALRSTGLVLVVMGVTIYELTFLALLLAFLLYRTRVSWTTALRWAIADWILLGLTYVIVLAQSQAEHLPLDDALSHGWTVFKQGFTVFATIALPFDSVAAALVVVAIVLLTTFILVRRLPTDDSTRAALVRWLWTVAAAVVMVVAAYAIYAPSAAMYVPLAPGLLNRTNAFAALPMLVLVYALCALVGLLLFRGLRDGRGLAALCTLALVTGIVIDYTVSMTRDLKLWDSAWARAHASLELVYAALQPPPPHHSLVVLFGTPIQEVTGVPVWAHTWDFDSALRLRYGDTTLRGRPAFPGTIIQCDATRVVLTNPTYPGVVLPDDYARYGLFFFVDANTGTHAVPRNQTECQTAVTQFTPGPWVTTDPGARDPG